METRDRIHEKRLLVVDDAPEIRALVRAVLEDEGYTNLAFAAGHAEALAEFQRVSPETLEFSTKPPSERIFCSSPETDTSKSVVSMETFAE